MLSLLKISHCIRSSFYAISKSYFHDFRDLRRVIDPIDQTTACTIAISLVHSKVDYCNSLLLNLPASQTNRLQLVLSSAVPDVTQLPNSIILLLFLNLFIGYELIF